MDFPAGEPITVITRTKSGVDDYGDDVNTESSVTVTGAFDPAIGYESTSGSDQVVSQPQVLLPYDTAVDSNSVIVRSNGRRYEVDGEPNYWRDPFDGTEFGVAVPLKIATG